MSELLVIGLALMFGVAIGMLISALLFMAKENIDEGSP